MVLNTITNNMEKRMKSKTAIRFSDATKKNALSLLSKGWTIAEVAKKHKTTVQSIHNWKKDYPDLATKTVITSLSKTGTPKVKTVSKSRKKPNTVTITLSETFHKEIAKQAREDCRTIDQQVRYYVLNGVRNYRGIPF